jgi:hypothetical protein
MRILTLFTVLRLCEIFHLANSAFAPDIAKYIIHYQTLYPHARILLLFNTLPNMLWRPDWVQMEDLQPAVWAIDDFLDSHNSKPNTTVNEADSKRREATVVFHIFSNGGAHMAVQLAQAYRENIRMSSPPPKVTVVKQLPISALIFDSCPGHARYSTAGKTTLSFLPKNAYITRTLAMPVVYLLLGGFYLCHVLGIAETVVVKLWRELSDPKGAFLFKQSALDNGQAATGVPHGVVASTKRVIPRTYICSQADEMIPAEDVFEHAAVARHASGLTDDAAKDAVRVEEIVGSMHVNHVTVDKERYWNIVNETLERVL